MRRGKVLGIRREEIDLDKLRLSVREAVLTVSYKIEIANVNRQVTPPRRPRPEDHRRTAGMEGDPARGARLSRRPAP